MLDQNLTTIISELEKFIEKRIDQSIQPGETVCLGNIAQFDSSAEGLLANKVVVTLVNIEEESTLKNTSTIEETDRVGRQINPVLNINLYLLFCATHSNYGTALHHMELILEFFQGKRHFTTKNTSRGDPQIQAPEEFEFFFNLYSPTFEMWNFLWSTLGGKQMPAVLYKARLAIVGRRTFSDEAPLIKKIATIDKRM